MLHGGDLTGAMALFGGASADWLDLSTGINPHAYPLPQIAPRFWQALPTKGDLEALLAVAREAYRIPPEVDLVAAPGTQALIQWMPRLCPEGGTAVLGPTYNEHARAFAEAGRSVVEIADLRAWRDQPNLIVVNPNNPDGRLLPGETLHELAEEAARRGGWLIVDESFIDVVPDQSAASLCEKLPLVILRSFGKFYGLAGVRLGFAVADAPIARLFEAALGPWAAAGPALAIGWAALADVAWADKMRASMTNEARQLDQVLSNGSCQNVGGTWLYRLVRHSQATHLHQHLARHRIWVRKFDWDASLLRFGLPGSDEGLMRLGRALAAFVAHASPHGVTTSSPSTV